jgi:anti-sigma factor ChrR (cupin superfamily)
MDSESLSQLASLYALNTLDEAEQSWVADQYAHLLEFQAEVAETEAIAAMLAYQVNPMPMASDLKTRLFQRIAAEDQAGERGAIRASTIDGSAEITGIRSVETLIAQAKAANWEPYLPTPGVQFARIRIDLDARRADCFVRSFGQVKFPEHRHAGDEEIVVLAGDLVIGNQTYVKGDRVYSQAGTVHQPETRNGCTLFLRTSLDDELL